jgi:hypothetical protein
MLKRLWNLAAEKLKRKLLGYCLNSDETQGEPYIISPAMNFQAQFWMLVEI